MRIVLYLIGLWLYLPIGSACAQLGFRTFTFTTENGLPSNGIKGLQWDEASGFLWVATEAGLSRFNGIEFKNYTRANSSFISSERLRFMVRNLDGQIRAADMNGNVLAISKSQPILLQGESDRRDGWESRLVGAGISDDFFGLGLIPNRNRITFPFAQIIPRSPLSAWMVNPGGGVVDLDMNKGVVEMVEGLGKDNLSGFVIEKKLYLQKRGMPLIYRYDEKKNVQTLVSAKLPDPGLKIYWESGMEFPIAIQGRFAWIILGNDEGLTFDLLCSDVPNLGLIKYVQYSKRRGLLFLGTLSKGFAVVRTNRVTQIKKTNASSTDIGAYYSQWEWENGSILTNEGHVLGSTPTKNPPIDGRVGFSIYEDGDSLVWFSKGQKNKVGSFLHCLNKKTGEDRVFDKIDIFNVFAFARWGACCRGQSSRIGCCGG